MNVLDQGFVNVIEVLGTDLTVVNSARVSYGKRKETFDQKDEKLIKYLIKHQHLSPFRHPMVQFHVKAPEFVTRQWYKHVVGIETTSTHACKTHAFNEISGRYVVYDSFYQPDLFRAQSTSSKQGSSGNILKQEEALEQWNRAQWEMQDAYTQLLALGVAKEQARCVLPLTLYTEFYWTASFQAIMHFISLRDAPHAQWEIREYARVIKDKMCELFPISSKYWISQEEETRVKNIQEGQES